jgi:hypothetical protein
LVTLATLSLVWGLPTRWLESRSELGFSSLLQIAAVIGAFILWLAPIDFFGGYFLPKKFNKSSISFTSWLRRYVAAALLQGLLFVVFGFAILFIGQRFGTAGAMVLVSLLMMMCLIGRNLMVLNRELSGEASSAKPLKAVSMIQAWRIFVPKIIIVQHDDLGFTGGVTGIGRNAAIIIPQAWLSFETDELATAIARRAVAISNGSYYRGLAIAFFWNLAGFGLSVCLPGANVVSVAGLTTALSGFTLWSFLGLLILPTVSRRASLRIDKDLLEFGLPIELISRTASSMDQLQDNEPDRPGAIETIFHPVPSVNRRNHNHLERGFPAWNVARTTLFLSWACLGFLSRSVHCNVGRPELWLMLPSD